MIKICVDARMIDSSGIGTCIKNLLPFLSKKPFELTILVRRPSGQPKYKEIVFDYPIYSIQEQLAFPFRVPRCDLFWSPHYNTPFLPIRARKRVVTIHDVCHLGCPGILSPTKRWIAKCLLKGSSSLSDRIVTDSEFSKKEIDRFLAPRKDKIEVIYPGVDGEKFAQVKADVVKRKYGLNNRYFLFVGNLKKHKNVSGLIKAFSLFSKEQSVPFDLVLVGKYQGLREVDSFVEGDVKRIYNIKVLGEIPFEDLPGVYSGAECFVFPSFYEGFGLPPLEAMACGVPVIASNRASLPEICGEAAYYVSPDNPVEIAAAMKHVAESPALKNELIEQGQKRYRIYDWAKAGAKYRSLFEKVLE